ncbi:MAG TPA: metallophosphoesterase [Pyrinomonadaceae bacterium]|nr:metallophosphoesterase [Pyrinomonadaceae bacterium]
MNARYLSAISLALLLSLSVQAQTSTGFPVLPQVPQTPALTDDPSSTHFIFIAAGDNRPAHPGDKQPQTLSDIFTDSQQYKPAFMLWSGDTIAGFRIAGQPIHHKTLSDQYDEFFGIAAKAGVAIFNSPGNHEMDSLEKLQSGGNLEVPDKDMQALYLEKMNYPANATPYGAFNYGNSRFIAVDTEEIPTMLNLRSGGKIVGNLKLDPGFVSQEQITLLTNDLEANKSKDHIFVFMHHPIMPVRSGSQLNEANAKQLTKLFAKYPNVSFVIAAHEHLYYNPTGKTSRVSPTSGGPIYLVSGGAGAPLDYCPGSAGKNCVARNHYLLFEVNGKKVDMKVVFV